MVGLLVVAFALVPGVTSADDQQRCASPKIGLRDAPKVGRVFHSGDKTDFDDSNPHDHVPDRWAADSNYSSDQCDRRIVAHDDGANDTDVLEQQIFANSDSDRRSGDVSIYRSYRGRPSHKYEATARVDLRNPSGDFRGRLKLSAWNDNDQKKEQFIDLCSDGSDESNGNCVAFDNNGFQVISFETERWPRGTNVIKIAWRARETRDEDASGVAILDWIRYVRTQ